MSIESDPAERGAGLVPAPGFFDVHGHVGRDMLAKDMAGELSPDISSVLLPRNPIARGLGDPVRH